MCLMSIITDFAGKTIFWLGRIMLILIPVGISYSKNLGKDQKNIPRIDRRWANLFYCVFYFRIFYRKYFSHVVEESESDSF